MKKNMLFAALALIVAILLTGCRPAEIKTHTPPMGEPPFDMYTLKVNGRDTFVYQCRVSAKPENQVWPGYQRPLDQTELAGFAYWDQHGPAQIEITSSRDIETLTIRPLSRNIKPDIRGNTITFTLPRPQYLTVEVNGIHHALHLFPSAPENFNIDRDDKSLIAFGPGIHTPGEITLKSDQTVYIAPGAVVHGVINADDARNIRILGRGILDASTVKRGEKRTMLSFMRCKNILVSGIILRDPHVWAAVPRWCENVTFEDLKLIGCWRYNSDGFDFLDSRDCVTRNCFLRTFDDSLVVKSWDPNAPDTLNTNITFKDCVIWNDWGISLGITYETRAKNISNITFQNIDVIHSVAARHVMTINPNDRGHVHNVLYKDIRVEDARLGLIELIIRTTMWSSDPTPGRISNITFENISVLDGPFPPSNFQGHSPEHNIQNITIKNLNILGEQIRTPNQGRFTINGHVKELKILP